MKRILVPTDFSRPAQWAVEMATDIARKAKAEVILLHVVEQPTKQSFNVEGEVSVDDWEDELFTFKLIERNKAKLLEQADIIRQSGVSCKVELRMGNPFHGIKIMIVNHQVDLIIMGTFNRSRVEEFLIGSNTEKVIRFASCPVLTVHHKPSTHELKNIVYATSMSTDEKAFSEVIGAIQEIYGSIIHFVRINTPLNFQPDTKVKIIMDDFVRKTRLKNYTVNSFNDFSEEEGILHFASKINADLIGMATHGRTSFDQVLLGSIAEDVAMHSQRPVLTFVIK